MSVHNKIVQYLSRPALLNIVLPFLMLYLIIGTVAQKYIGLYEATKIFFSAPVLWLGPLPLPGLPVLLAALFINLTCKLIFKSPWNRRNMGVIVTHIGAMLLLLGGLFTALFSSEGYIELAQGEQKNFVSDYHAREFALLDDTGKALAVYDHEGMHAGRTLIVAEPALHIKILEACRNCRITKRSDATPDHQGMAQHMQLSVDKPELNDEENMAGLTFSVSGEDVNQIFVALENVPKLPEIAVDGKTYRFMLRRQQRALPFSVELLEFRRDMHPGTALAKAYQSRVRIHDGKATWESMISMNEPLRYKGYTFFQSSFIETPRGDVSVLAAVWNAGRSFPYVSGIAMCLGVILHLFARRVMRQKNERGADAA